jgi:murein DD-endopeptidase MepM/ murein hydrolase activator NlpD
MAKAVGDGLTAYGLDMSFTTAAKTSTNWHWPTGSSDADGYGFLRWNPNYSGWHLAQDFAIAQSLPVYAIAGGEVILSRTDVGGYGPVDPSTGKATAGGALVARFITSGGQYFLALYGHLDNPHPTGEIQAGEILGYVNAYDPSHLHFGIHLGYGLPADGNPWRGYTHDRSNTYGWVDPVQFLLDNSPPIVVTPAGSNVTVTTAGAVVTFAQVTPAAPGRTSACPLCIQAEVGLV